MDKRLSSSSVEEVNTSHSDHEEAELSDSDELRSIGGGESDVEKQAKATSSTKRQRQKKVPAKFRDSAFVTGGTQAKFEAEMRDKKVCVKCNQTGKLFRVKVTALSRVDEECMTEDDLAKGSQLLMTNNKKSYPVSVQKVVSALGDATAEQNSKSVSKNPRKRPAPPKTNSKAKRLKALDKENLEAAKLELTQGVKQPATEAISAHSSTSRAQTLTSPSSGSPKTDRELLLEIKDMIGTILNQLRGGGGGASACKVEEEEYIVDGINLLRIPSKDAYAYARTLLNMLFTKQERKQSVVLKSSKSSKPPLSPQRVQKLFDCVQQRYRNDYLHKDMMATLNQKCRDAKPDS